jgi:hypothetical protein
MRRKSRGAILTFDYCSNSVHPGWPPTRTGLVAISLDRNVCGVEGYAFGGNRLAAVLQPSERL